MPSDPQGEREGAVWCGTGWAAICPECKLYRLITERGRFRRHYRNEIDAENSDPCSRSGQLIPPMARSARGVPDAEPSDSKNSNNSTSKPMPGPA